MLRQRNSRFWIECALVVIDPSPPSLPSCPSPHQPLPVLAPAPPYHFWPLSQSSTPLLVLYPSLPLILAPYASLPTLTAPNFQAWLHTPLHRQDVYSFSSTLPGHLQQKHWQHRSVLLLSVPIPGTREAPGFQKHQLQGNSCSAPGILGWRMLNMDRIFEEFSCLTLTSLYWACANSDYQSSQPGKFEQIFMGMAKGKCDTWGDRLPNF